MTVLRVAAAQLRNAVGDIQGNADRVAEAMAWAEEARADVLVLPELVLTGYPPEDLVLHGEFVAEAEEALDTLAAQSASVVSVVSSVVGVPPRRSWDSIDRTVAIGAAVLSGGERRGTYHKVLLPTHGAYDEGKNFAPGQFPDQLWRIGNAVCGLCICEDLWSGDGPPEQQSIGGARVMLAPNASPYHRRKPEGREELAASVARRNGLPLVYVNLVGGQDELVFDGGSLVLDAEGGIIYRAEQFAEERFVVDLQLADPRPETGPVKTVHTRPLADRVPAAPRSRPQAPDEFAYLWGGLVTGTRDFVHGNDFEGAVLGLSGGIDSAMTAALAADALGPERVLGVAMPGPDADPEEETDAARVASDLGIEFAVVPVSESIDAVASSIAQGLPEARAKRHLTDLAARIRALALAAIAVERDRLVLATDNKTELSIGVQRGDVSGDFAPLRDCPKTLLYEFARQRGDGETFPKKVLHKETTAQSEEGDLPSYEILDRIVESYIELGQGLEDIVADGIDPKVVLRVVRQIDDAEFKRRQTPPGVKISPRAFGTDRRMPLSNAWRPYRRREHFVPGLGREGFRLDPETPSIMDTIPGEAEADEGGQPAN